MARKVSLIVIWPMFPKTKWPSCLKFNVKWDYPIKKALYFSYRKSRPETLFQLMIFTFDPSSMSSGVILLQRPYISFSSPLLLILRQEITAVAVALLLLLVL